MSCIIRNIVFVCLVLASFVSVSAQDVSGTHNGHDYVDLGLPSGTLWATCNVGAKSPEQYGDYLDWGLGSYRKFTYRGVKDEQLKQNGLIDDKGNLTEAYDIASLRWGGEWKIPTIEDIKELKECESRATMIKGKRGIEIIGKNGNKLFLPFAGYRFSTWSYFIGEYGCYWSATVHENGASSFILNFGFEKLSVGYMRRDNDLSVRPILKLNNNNKEKKPNFDLKTPPNLDIIDSLVFTDTDRNNAIDASESCSINFDVKNSGKGAARNCVVKIRTKEAAQYLTFSEQKIDLIEAGKSKKVSVPIKAGMNTADGSVTFVVSVYEPNGFGTDEYEITVPTRAFVAPLVLVQDYAVSTEAGSMIKKKQAFDLQLLIQNTKNGNANDVSVSVELPQNVMLMETMGKEKIGTLDGGDTATVTYTLIATNNYQGSTIPIKVNVKEKYGMYAQSKTITLDMNQSIANNKVVVAASVTNNNKEIKNVSIGSDVDKDIPQSQAKSPNTFVLIIANENYQNGVDGVAYANRDGEVFRQYCEKTLGIPKSNIELYSDATYGNMVRGIGWLQDVVKAYKGDAKVVLYYTGHGTPDETTKDAYLVPTDGDPKSARTLYKLDDLYNNLGQMDAKSVTVFLDACFSGSTKSDKMIVAAKSVAVTPKKSTLQGNMVVMSAATGSQTAMVYEEQKHSLFTYYLLKKLKETKGEATMKQIFEYVEDQVGKTSVVVNKKSQTPTCQSSPSVREEWKEWKMR